MSKKISIVVLVVIVIVAGYFVFRQKQVELVVVDPVTYAPVQEVVKFVDGRQCYTYSHEATATEPYATTEFIDITIAGSNVTGSKRGTQNGPDMSNGYEGSMTGTLEGTTITSVFSYTIEGSKNKEKEIFKAGLTGIEKLRYPLIGTKGMLAPDTTKEFKAISYARVGCESSN